MSSFINEFKKMVDISEEGELLQKEVDELKCTEGGGDGDVVGDSSELFEVMLKRAEQKLQKKDEDYQRLLAETHTLRIEYDDYKRKSDQELKTLRRSLTQEQHAIKELTEASEKAGKNVDEIYIQGLTRQIESFKERDKQVQNDMIRLEKKAALAESARDQLESEKKADLDMMHTRMETWKERTESNQKKYVKEIEDLRERLATRRAVSPTGGVDEQLEAQPSDEEDTSNRISELESEVQKVNKELEDAHWASLNIEKKLNQTRQSVEEKSARIRQLEEEVESETSKLDHSVQEHKEATVLLENKISFFEEKLSAAAEEIERAKTQQNVRVEAIGQEQQHKQREIFELQSKIPELQQQNNHLSQRLEDEKETVQQLLQHIEEQRGDVRRKDDTITDMYHDTEDVRARLQGLESQSATYIENLESKEELINQRDVDITNLADRITSLSTLLSDEQQSHQNLKSELAECVRENKKKDTHINNIEFEFERAKSDLMHREGGERDTQQLVESKDLEIQQLRQRVLESDRKVGEIIRIKDEQLAKQRNSEERPSSRRSVSIARPGSPSVIDIVKSAASDSHPSALRKPVSRPVFKPTTKQLVITLSVFLVVVWMWFSSGVAKSTDQADLQDTINQLRTIITVKDRALASCKCT